MRSGQMAASAAMILVASAGWSGDATRNASISQTISSVTRPVQMEILGKSVQGAQIQPDHAVEKIDGQPLTAVVVTQCNLIEAVYLTMPDGKLLRFSANQLQKIPAGDLVGFVYTRAKVSERIETDCRGAAGLPRFEKHGRTEI